MYQSSHLYMDYVTDLSDNVPGIYFALNKLGASYLILIRQLWKHMGALLLVG